MDDMRYDVAVVGAGQAGLAIGQRRPRTISRLKH